MAKPMPCVEPVTSALTFSLDPAKSLFASRYRETLIVRALCRDEGSRCRFRRGGKASEAGLEIGLQIVDILEPDMEAERRACRRSKRVAVR